MHVGSACCAEPGGSGRLLAELAWAVREGRVLADELVQLAYERIERSNPELNAVIALRDRGAALEEARVVQTRARLGGASSPLLGLPLLVKDNSDVAGMRTTHGSLLFAEAPPAERDARVVDRLRAAGAIVVGKTNVPELSFQGFTDNALFGATRNPWGQAWSPGGSSGGSGAALAAGMVPLATATDGGGSVRIPAALCGLAGLKPTHGLVGRRPVPSWMDLSTDGPLATTVADVRLLLDVLRGPEVGDLHALDRWEPRGGSIRRVLAASRTWDFGPLPEELEERYRAVLRRIEDDLDLPVEELDLPEVFASGGHPGDDWFAIVAVEELAWIGRERVARNLERLSPAFRASMEDALEITIDRYVEARRNRFGYARWLDERLAGDAVFVCPTLGYAGWLADGRLPDTDRIAGPEGYNTGETNLTGHPSLSVPAGVCPNGIPFGLQITGPRWRDDLVLDVGSAWEMANQWPVVAPGYEPFAT